MTKLIEIILGIIITMGLIESSQGEAQMWREPASQVKRGKAGSVIVDRGVLTATIMSNCKYPNRGRYLSGCYLFSEVGAGVKPLVLIGTPVEMLEFFAKNQDCGIENRINELPDIYMGITRYIPGKRFTGLFPMQDFMKQFVENATKFVPGGDINDVAGNFADFVAYIKKVVKIKKWRKKGSTLKKSSNLLYLKFSYIREDGMEKIAERTISFGDLLRKFQSKMPSVEGYKPNLSGGGVRQDDHRSET